MRKHNVLYYLMAFFINLIIISGIFYYVGLVPFGDGNFLTSDLGTQYIAFLTELRRQLVTGNIHLYLFSQSLGDNFFPIISYYLLSPFNLLLVLFTSSTVPIAADVIIMLKISAMGLTMAYFLAKYFKNTRYSNYLFTVAYSFCGFVASYFYDLMWLDALIMLPLVACGLLKLIDHNKVVLYYISLFLAIVFNYYLGYMLCIFSVCFFIYLALEKNLLKQKNRFVIIRNFIISSVLAGMSAAFVLIPTFSGMMKTAKTSFDIFNYLPSARFGFEAFTQLGIGGNTFAQRLHHGPSVFMTSTALILLLGYFFSKRVTKQDKEHAFFLIGVLLLSMFVTTFNTVWHMFQNPAGFPFRNSFIFSFICIFIAHKAFSAGVFKDANTVISASCTAGILICIGYLTEWMIPKLIQQMGFGTPYNEYNIYYFALTLLCITITGIFIYLYGRNKYFGIVLMLMVIFEVGANFVSVIDTAGFGSQSIYQKQYKLESEVLTDVKKESEIGHRIIVSKSGLNKAFPEQYNNYNDPILFNINGLSLYSSTLSQDTLETMNKLGYFSRNVRRISYIGGTSLTNTLFGVDYDIGQWNHSYEVEADYNSPSLGFLASPDIYDFQMMSNRALDNQNRLWQAINGDNKQYFKNAKIDDWTKTKLGKKNLYEYKLTTTANGELYLYTAPINYVRSKVYINGKKVKMPSLINSSIVIDLGDYDAGEKLSVGIKTRKPLEYDPGYFKTLDSAEFNQSKNTIRQNSLNITSRLNHDTVRGKINVKKASPMLFTIPYDKGWKAFDNGKEVKTYKVVNNLTAIDLDKGYHKIILKYEVPGLKIGWIISIISVVLFGVFLIVKRKIDPKEES
ncbi:YfhO family protein [Companilactobacillus baiquanensis]|uniref:YfhO family protein n=1 Tax=Companilactobacillus baiquanensis TaxID=2486005 RepID=A0ABW1UWD1_9LACO|nr:YfhO family protein [Companilactobacillus baiquanensis]